HHAPERRPLLLPVDRARDPHRRGRGPRPGRGALQHRARHGAAHDPPGERGGDVGRQARLRDHREDQRRVGPGDPLPAPAAERQRHHRGAGDVRAVGRHPRRGRTELPRLRGAAAPLVAGPADPGGRQLHAAGASAAVHPGRGARSRDPLHQPHRRHDARSARSARDKEPLPHPSRRDPSARRDRSRCRPRRTARDRRRVGIRQVDRVPGDRPHAAAGSPR
ncbi:hypothetical protein OY671_008929, partial [Metschnikowia pulcherrima]